MDLSKKTVLNCFPHKEAILYNLDVAITLMDNKQLIDGDRLNSLFMCHQNLRENNPQKAAQYAKRADYHCMAQAILIHYGV